MTYYQKLNISPDASGQQIKEAYRRLAFENHPDRNKDNPGAAEKMKAINEAYAVLSNPEKRRQYDALYHRYGENASQRFRQSFSEQDIFKGSDVQKIFEEMARSCGLRGFDEIFADFYGQGGRRFGFQRSGLFSRGFVFAPSEGAGKGSAKHKNLLGKIAQSLFNKAIATVLPQKGNDIHDAITLQPEIAVLGGPFAFFHRKRDKKLVVHIPAGVRDGQVIRLNGMGKNGSHGAPPGDLLLKVHIKRTFLEKLKIITGRSGRYN